MKVPSLDGDGAATQELASQYDERVRGVGGVLGGPAPNKCYVDRKREFSTTCWARYGQGTVEQKSVCGKKKPM